LANFTAATGPEPPQQCGVSKRWSEWATIHSKIQLKSHQIFKKKFKKKSSYPLLPKKINFVPLTMKYICNIPELNKKVEFAPPTAVDEGKNGY
jgi:hypothetical protein